MLATNVLFFLYLIYHLVQNNYLPSPFIYDKNDTFMDFFNPLYWAYNEDRYTQWLSVYPPLDFLILKGLHVITGGSFQADPFSLRDSGNNIIALLVFIFLASPLLVLANIKDKCFGSLEKIIIYFIFIFSVPFLFTLERGNLIIFALPLVSVLFLKNNNLLKVISISILINIKPYFVVLALPFILKKKWDEFIKTIFFSTAIYSISSIILGNDFFDFLLNIITFESNIFSLREILAMPSSIMSIYIFLQNYVPSSSSLYNPMYIFSIIILFAYITLAIFIVYISIKYKNNISEVEFYLIILISMTVFFYQIGGYSIILYLSLVPILYREFKYGLFIVIIIFMPTDLIPLYSDLMIGKESFFSNFKIDINYNLGLGSILRPSLNYLLLAYISFKIFDRIKQQKKIRQ